MNRPPLKHKDGFLGITPKIALFSIAMMLITVIILGMVTYLSLFSDLKEGDLTLSANQVRKGSIVLKEHLKNLRNDVLYLAETPPIQGVIRASENQGLDLLDQSSYQQWRIRLIQLFKQMIRLRPDYLSIRYIGLANDGLEIVRLDRNAETIKVVSEKNLQAKGQRPYFQNAQTLEPNKVYLTDINLNREFGEISKPYTPVFRAVVPIYSKTNKKFFGAIVINVNISSIFDRLNEDIVQNKHLLVTNSNGDYLYHPDSEKTFGFEFGKENRIQQLAPTIVYATTTPAQIDSAIVYTNKNGKSFALHIKKVALDKDDPKRFIGLISISDYSEAIAHSLSIGRQVLISGFLVTCFVSILVWFFARTLTQPLRHIIREIALFGEGKLDLDLPVNAKNEVGTLARTFDDMSKEIVERTRNLEDTIRERKQAEESFRQVVESTPNGLLMIGSDRKITLVNAQTEELFGYSRKELVGQTVELLIPERLRTNHPTQVRNFFETPSRRQMGVGRDLYGRRKDGTEFPVEIGLNPIQTGNGILVLCALVDITQRKKTADTLKHYASELEQSNNELDEFAYIASHDLKEPLRGIRNYSTILIEDYGDMLDDEGKSQLHTLKRLTTRMESLIENLLEYSRIGRSNLAVDNVDLSEIVNGVIDTIHVSLKEASVEVRIPKQLPITRCDRARIGEVFRNLLTNAMKYNDKSEKWIEVGFLDATKASEMFNEILEANPISHTVFYVKDNGIGISKKHQDKAFQMFKRLHGRDKFGGGTGVGLTIVKKIIEKHNGNIWIISNQGEGTTFYFTLPGVSN